MVPHNLPPVFDQVLTPDVGFLLVRNAIFLHTGIDNIGTNEAGICMLEQLPVS